MTQARNPSPRTWVLLGQKAGDNHQVLALADALGWPYEVREIRNRPWELATNLLAGTRLWGIDRRRSSPLASPWPELVISAGRRNEPVARWLQRQSGGRARLVHIGRPWAPPAPAFLIRLVAPLVMRTDPSLVLQGQYAVPARLEAEGFRFRAPRIESALRALAG